MALKWLSSIYNPSINFGVDVTIEIDGSSIIDWSSEPGAAPYVMGMGMLDVYLNGIFLQKGTWRENTATSIEYLDTERPLRVGDVLSIRYKHNSVSLGQVRVVGSYAELAAIPKPTYNEVAIVTGNKKFYKYGDSGWEEFVIPFTTQNIGTLFRHETQVITDVSQTQFAMQNISYSPNMGGLLVFLNGDLVNPLKYTEVDNKTISFNESIPLDSTEIEFVALSTDSWEDSFNHAVDYGYDANGNASRETLTFNDVIVKQTDFTYDTEGNITKETVIKGDKTIIKDYTYDASGNVAKITVSIIC